MSELFDMPETKSPRLLWMDKHGVWTKHYESPSIVKNLSWVATAAGKSASGATEDESIVNLAMEMNIKLWNEV